jgi:hypothetical protein
MQMAQSIIALLAAAAVSAAGLALAYDGGWITAWSWAMGVTVIHAAAAGWINRRALRAGSDRFFLWALGAHGARAGALLLIVLAAQAAGLEPFRPFVAAVFTCYFSLMGFEVLRLHRATVRMC